MDAKSQYLAQLQVDEAETELMIIQFINLKRKRRHRRGRQIRRQWVREWLMRRETLGQYHRLMPELRAEDPTSFVNFLRVPPEMFDELLTRIGPRITKQDTFYRKSFESGMKLAITLRHLASGDKYASLKFDFRVAHSTISLLVREVCQAIIDEYAKEVVSCPTTPVKWRAIAEEFYLRWNFPHAVGAVGGKHVSIKCPKSSESFYYNYKGFYYVVLMALVDADYKFIWVDVRANGSASDAQIFNHSELKETIEDWSIGFPAPEPLPHDDKDMPYNIIGDDAFALRIYMMKPFSHRNMTVEERIFNYMLSRGRRIVENAFGILSNRFQILLSTMQHNPDTVRLIVQACVCLHNLMRIRYPGLQNASLDVEDDNHQMVDGAWRNCRTMQDVDNVTGPNRDTRAAKSQREYLKHYLNSPAGSVPWQNNMI